MKILSSKTYVLLGFVISLTSIVINTIVLSNIDTRSKVVDSEYSGLVESLGKQAAELNEADLKFDLYRIMHNVAFSVPLAKAKDTRKDAEELLKGALTSYYAAANDVSKVDVTRVEVEEMGDDLPKLEKIIGLVQAIEKSTDQSERARLASELEKLSAEQSPPKSELAKQLREVGQYARVESTAGTEMEIMFQLIPLARSLREQIVGSVQKKENRMRELERMRASLETKSKYATYAAISLQIIGLMLIFTEDLVKDKRPPQASGGSSQT